MLAGQVSEIMSTRETRSSGWFCPLWVPDAVLLVPELGDVLAPDVAESLFGLPALLFALGVEFELLVELLLPEVDVLLAVPLFSIWPCTLT